jgi:hypothetical protein
MRDLVKSAKRDRRDKWKENAQNDHRTGMWFVKTTGELVQPGGRSVVVDGAEYEPFDYISRKSRTGYSVSSRKIAG